MTILRGWRSLSSRGTEQGARPPQRQQHLVLPETDARSGMQAERLPQPACSGTPGPSYTPPHSKIQVLHTLWWDLFASSVFQVSHLGASPGLAASWLGCPDSSICNVRSCMVQVQKHSSHGGQKISPDHPSPSPTNEAGPAHSFIAPGNWKGEKCVGSLAHRT